MRILIAIAFVYALVLGVGRAAGPSAAELAAPPAERSAPAAEDTSDEAPPETEIETGYECRYSPYCQKASQCLAYCAGGAPACVNGCCACAS
jgi:hypothetical protein